MTVKYGRIPELRIGDKVSVYGDRRKGIMYFGVVRALNMVTVKVLTISRKIQEVPRRLVKLRRKHHRVVS